MRICIAILSLICINTMLTADDKPVFPDRIRLKASVFNEGIIIPFYPHFTSCPIHPGMQFGCEYYYLQKGGNRLFQTVNAGFFLHKKYENGIYLNSEVGYRYVLWFGLSFDALLGVGYLHTISDVKEFKQDENGVYREITSFGRPHLLPSAAFSLGYDFSKKTGINLHSYISYQFMIEYPWSTGEYGLSPVLPRTNLHIGVIFKI